MKRVNAKLLVTALLMLFLSWGNFQIFGLYFFIIFQVCFCVLALYSSGGKLHIGRKDSLVWYLLIMSLLTEAASLCSGLPGSFKKYSLVMTIVLLPSYVCYSYLSSDFKRDGSLFPIVMKYLRIGFAVQLLVIPVQLILHKVGIDINRILFHNILHLMDAPTFYRQGTYYPSGFVWHSAVLAPLFVLGFLMIENTWLRGLILLDAFICGNNTALLGVALVVFFMFLRYAAHLGNNHRVKKRILITALAAAALAVVVLVYPKTSQLVFYKVTNILNRIFQGQNDTSSAAHFSYYLLYPQAAGNNGLLCTLFGTGYGSSGHSITAINGQYAGLPHWEVESDFISILLSRGILGFIGQYAFMLSIAIRGRKIDYRYWVAMVVIILQGITYNVQFEYLFFIELIMYATIKSKRNFFVYR